MSLKCSINYPDLPASRPDSMTFQGVENLSFKFHDFPGSVCTLTKVCKTTEKLTMMFITHNDDDDTTLLSDDMFTKEEKYI